MKTDKSSLDVKAAVRSTAAASPTKSNLNERGLRRLKNVIQPHGPLPISRSSWFAGVKAGLYPRPVRLGPRMVAYREVDIQKLIDDGVAASSDGVL
jgi:prophage regulatory protein